MLLTLLARKPAALSVLLAVVVLAIWQIAIGVGWVPAIILPPPTSIAVAFLEMTSESLFYEHLWVTMFEIASGYAIGIVVGFALGVLLGTSRLARQVSRPYVVGFQGTPKIVFAPLFVTALGFGTLPKTMMAAAISFFPILINTEAGILSADIGAKRLMASMEASSSQILRKLLLPNALPYIFAGLKTGLTLAVIGALVGEFFGASAGLGFLLESYTYQMNIPRLWSVVVVLMMIGVALFMLIEAVERKVVFWD